MNEISFLKWTKIKVFTLFVLFLPSAKTIARQIYFYCWNEIAYFFVKALFIFNEIFLLSCVIQYKSATPVKPTHV